MADNPLDILKMLSGTPAVTVYNNLAYATNARTDKAVGGASNVTLTEAEAAHYYLRFTGTLTGNIIVYVPQKEKPYLFRNDTTGAFTLTVQPVTSGTGGLLARSVYTDAYCDGTNLQLFPRFSSVGGFTGIGTPTPELFVHAVAPDGTFTHAAFDSYVENIGGTYLFLGHNRGTFAAPTFLNIGDLLGGIAGRTIARNAADSADAPTALGYVLVRVDSKDAQGRMGGSLVFLTSSGGSASSTEKARLTEIGNFLLGTTVFGTGAARTLVLGNGTAPSTSPADVTQVWSADRDGVAGRAGLHVRSETGTMHALADDAAFSMLANGQKLSFPEPLTELTTIAAAETTTTTIQIPANAVVFGVSVRVTVAIPTAATFSVGVSGATTRYGTGLSVAANTTHPGTNTPMTFYSAQAAIVITPNLTPAANTGRVRVTIHYYTITPPTS